MPPVSPPKLLASIGIKPAISRTQAYCRILASVLLIVLIIWGIYNEHEDTDRIEDLSDIIKKDSALYRNAIELDPKYQARYVRMLKSTFNIDNQSILSKYYKGIIVAIIAAIYSEYITGGISARPLNGIAKTVVSTAWYNLLS